MKSLLPFLLIALIIAGCHSNRDENSFDTNAAEATDYPAERDRGNSETNEQAALRDDKTESNKLTDKTHPALTELSSERTAQKSDFTTKASDASLAEIHLAELALKKTKDEKIKAFAESMLKDHTAANQELKKLAEQKGMKVSAECTTCDAAYKTLHDLGTEEFNQQYAEMMVTDHERAVKLFTDESKSGADADLKAWAKEKLPVLEHHLAMAKDLDQNSNVSAKKPAAKESAKQSKKSAKEPAKSSKKARKQKG